MATGRRFARKRMPLTLAFAVLTAAAIGAGCNGFFTGNTLNSITIQPPSPQIEAGQQATVQAWGTYSDNSRSQITSGVTWTSDTPAAVCFVSGTSCVSQFTGGAATAEGVVPGGTSTITAAAQGLSATATATAYLGNVTNFEVCLGSFVAGQSCNTSTWAPSSAKGGTQDYYVQATYNGSPIDLTIASDFGAISPATTAGSITCTNTTTPASCTVVAGTLPDNTTYQFTVTYGTTNSVNVSIDLGP